MDYSPRESDQRLDGEHIIPTVAFEEHGRWLKSVIYARSGSPEAVDEIYQEVVLAYCRKFSEVPEAALAPWLYRVAVTQSLLYRRKLGRFQRLKKNFREQVQPGVYGEEYHNPLEFLLCKERRILIRKAMEKLSCRDAEILILKYTENWSYRNLAEKLGISESAVEARLFRARNRLRKELQILNVIEVSS